jgi:hypothetical protein
MVDQARCFARRAYIAHITSTPCAMQHIVRSAYSHTCYRQISGLCYAHTQMPIGYRMHDAIGAHNPAWQPSIGAAPCSVLQQCRNVHCGARAISWAKYRRGIGLQPAARPHASKAPALSPRLLLPRRCRPCGSSLLRPAAHASHQGPSRTSGASIAGVRYLLDAVPSCSTSSHPPV